ncbi:MAG: acyltransferase family protein [Fimbriimonadaceae bacterium]
MSSHLAHLKPLTGIRALAALWVVLVHIDSLHAAVAGSGASDFIREYSILPVVFFFILSGFILSVVYLPRVEECGFAVPAQKKYAWSRAARIVPLYLFSLIPGVVFGCLWLSNRTVAWPLMGDLTSNSAWLGVNGWGFNVFLRSNVPAWTLTAELIFYLMFPWLMSRVLKWDREKCLFGLMASLFGYLMIQLGLGLMQMMGSSAASQFGKGVGHFGSPIFVPTFVAGVLLGLAWIRGWIPEKILNGTAWIYGGLVVSVLFLTQTMHSVLPPSLVTGLLAPAFCLVVLAGAGSRGSVNKLLSSKVMQSLGAASYAIYITHWPVKGIMQFYFHPAGVSSLQIGMVTFLVVMLVGYASHWWIEKPLHRWIMNRASA